MNKKRLRMSLDWFNDWFMFHPRWLLIAAVTGFGIAILIL